MEDVWFGIDTWSHEPDFGGEDASVLMKTVEFVEHS
jgi:hypothetical protein